MKLPVVFGGVALLAALAGTALWLGSRSQIREPVAVEAIAPTALYAANFQSPEGASRSLGQFQGKLLVINFWATWCAPCRAEMPAFDRVATRWAGQPIQVVGLSAEDPAVVAQFQREVPVGYPLWTGPAAEELSRRLGNRVGVLPHTVFLDAAGKVLESRIGPYTEAELETRLKAFVSKSS